MIVTFAVMAAVAVVAAAIAWWIQRNQRPAPTTVAGAPPGSLDRSDFLAPEAQLLIAVFTSNTCSSCDAVWAELAGYESPSVAVQNVEVGEEPAIHKRYQIESVPTAVIVDASGETQAAFVGPLGPDHRRVLLELVRDAATNN